MSIAFPPPPLPPNPSLPSAGTAPRGFQGPYGPQGPQGFQGAQGVQGPQGRQGVQGPQGVTGAQGSQGTQGNDGPQGRQGNQGVLGMYGGYSVEYNYTAVNATNTDPGSGNLKINGSGWGSTTAIYASNFDAYGANVTAWLATLGASTNTIKGVIRFYKNGSSTVNTSYNITAATANSGYYALTVSNVIAAGTITIGDRLVMTFTRAGDLGSQGPQGAQGWQGVQGPQGVQGSQGVTGIQGPQGWQGAQGLHGPQGVTGIQGPQGWQGAQGLQGPQGVTGIQGPQGVQGPQGFQGTQGPTGTWTGTTSVQSAFTNNTSSTSTTTGAVTITGGLGVGGSVYIGGNTSTDSSGQIKAIDCSGYSVFRPIVEVMSTTTAVGSTYTHSWPTSAILDISGMTANCTLSLTNIPFPNSASVTDRAIVFTIIIRQSATPFYINALNINGTATTIRWPSATAPTATANRIEIESLTLLYRGVTWTAMGQFTSFG